MMILDSKAAPCFVNDDGVDLLDFEFDGEEDSSSSLDSFITAATTPFVSEIAEEELEWLSNKDAFPSVDTCFGILADNPQLIMNHHSPASVLENSSNSSHGSVVTVASCSGGPKVPASHPVGARSKGRRPRKIAGFGEFPRRHFPWLSQVNVKNKRETPQTVAGSGGGMGRRCLHCQTDKTPQWRAGPMGPKTLCNACGVRFKSGRLLPEYRPANSPTFSSALHSNSHRKVVEMRRQKIGPGCGGGIAVNEGCGYRVA